MLAYATAFASGALLQQQLPDLPPVGWTLLLPLCLFVGLRFPRLRLPMGLAVGFLWALAYAFWLDANRLAPGLEGIDLVIEGQVDGLPELAPDHARFDFLVARLISPLDLGHPPRRVRLSWYESVPSLRPGQRWRLLLRLKQNNGFQNPGGFDYEGWLFQHGIGATGYVRRSGDNRLLAASDDLDVDDMRAAVRDAVYGAVGDHLQAGLVLALAIGDRSGLTGAHWRALARTGTSHLMAISGLHIGIVAGLFFLLSRWLGSRSTALTSRVPAHQIAAGAAIFAAAAYAALAGFSVPTQRALVMLVVTLGALVVRRSPGGTHGLALSLILVTAMDPQAVRSAGFWLSFGAVAAILYGVTGRIRTLSLWRTWGRAQWLVFVALFPLLLLEFQQASLLAPLVNIVAVPWFSLVLVPLTLVSVLLLVTLPAVGEPLLHATAWLLQATFQGLEWLASWPWASWHHSVPFGWAWVAALTAVALVLAPRGLPGRWLAGILLLPLLLGRPPAPGPGELWLSLLDVGQGLAAVVRTHGHVLVYDTGPRFSDRFDAGSAVVLPFLRDAGVDAIDLLVLSNGDNDHAGGASALAAELPIKKVISGEPQRVAPLDAAPCAEGQSWTWDGARFRVLHPEKDGSWNGNNSSCVLRVENGSGSILLTGDIEQAAERRLTTAMAADLESTIVVAPHHGSATSSTEDFVRATSAKFALFSVGYRNLYGFPKTEIVERWHAAGARVFTTAQTGAMQFRLGALGVVDDPELARWQQRRYWTRKSEQSWSGDVLGSPQIQ